MPTVSQLFIYPIKSCRGVAVPEATVQARGLAMDRRFMLVDANGRFLTQRQHSRMALIDLTITDDGFRVNAPGRDALDLPASLPEKNASGTSTCQVKIWRQSVAATLADEDTNIWFSSYLGFACGLVYMGDDRHRPVENAAANFDDEVSFADGAPVLIVSEASLEDLNEKLVKPIEIQRFRPNILVNADPAFAEDEWSNIEIGEAHFDVAWPCSRCIMTTVDPSTGTRDSDGEPMRTLLSYRRRGRSVYFGQNLLPRSFGKIAVGDVLSAH